jgi:hypothetical protein
MPGINVIDNDGEVQRFPDASSWHVDDRGQLHLKSNAGPVASFAKDCWQGASTEDETGPAVKRTTLDDVTRELHEANANLRDIIRALNGVNNAAHKGVRS